jgi:hypothetical protein
MIRKGLRPGFRLGLRVRRNPGGYQRTWRFRRSWVAIGILAVMDVIFLIPAITTLIQARGQWSQFDSLFDLVGALFLSAWLLGWSVAPLLMTGILVLLLFGRETMTVWPGKVELALGLPFLSLTAVYDVTMMRNLRIETPVKKSGSSWRGPHFVFDYGSNQGSFGSDVEDQELTEVRNGIHKTSGKSIRRGEALAGEAETHWEPEQKNAAVAAVVESGAAARPVTLSSASSLALIAANLVPIAGALFLGWKLSDVMVLYWAESAVVGFFNLCKIVVIGRWFALVAGPFFLGHFGGFMAVHFLFIYMIFVKGPDDMNGDSGDLAEVAKLFLVLWPALLALAVSHAYSYFNNFLGRGEYRGRTVSAQMSEPYSRIIFMHLVLIFGGGLSLVLGQVEMVLIVVIAAKIFVDLKAHLREHSANKKG